MNTLPCIASRDADSHAARMGRIESRESAVEARTEELRRDIWQDLEHLADAFSDAAATVGYYRNRNRQGVHNHPQAVTLLTLLRDGTDEIEVVRLIREAMRAYIDQAAEDLAEEETP